MPLPTEDQLLEDIGRAPGQADSLRRLCMAYGLEGRQRVALRRLLTRLEARGALVKLRGVQRYGVPRERATLPGLLQGTARGFGFVSPDDPGLPDVHVAADDLNGALHGDRVEVRLFDDCEADSPAGEIVRVVKRGEERIVGQFLKGRRGEPHRLRPFDPRLAGDFVVPDRFTLRAEDGELVDTVLLAPARGGESRLQVRVTARLGHLDEPGTDERVIVRTYRLAEAHSPEAVSEAERLAARGITGAELARRRDLRGLRTVTIDGETARDFDDAVSIERVGPNLRLFVHIADVAAFVEEGGVVDSDALERATSVYFPGRAIHMLPEALSAGACSLRPLEDRLAMTVALDFDADGERVAMEAWESVIRSDRRMTYTEMKRVLVDRDPALRAELADFLPDFELMGELAARLLKAREARGGLDFDLPVPMVTVDEEGFATDIVESERNVAHRLIEEFMIAANRAVALKLDDAREPALHRNHEPPSPEKADAFREACAQFGIRFADGGEDGVTPKHFLAALEACAGRPEERLLSMLALRSLSLARYGPERLGHFGLALTHYCHFTSPIRRYPDLVVHRALKRLLLGQPTPADLRDDVVAEMTELGEHCSRRERNAEAAERALVEWKKVAFMSGREGETFLARVTGLSDHGLFLVLEKPMVDGFVRFRDLRPDWYERDRGGFRVVGRDRGRVLRLGDRLKVRLTSVDQFRRRLDFEEA